MSAPRAFNITPRMIHLQSFHWFKQFAEGSILMDTALDNIEFALGSDFDSGEWMDLAYCIMMEPGCWGDVEKVWMQQLGIEESSSSSELPSQPSRGSIVSGNQESSSAGLTSTSSVSTLSGPLLNDPCAWRLMMDWAKDKIRYGELDDRMRKYGSRYIHKEWKPLINEIFLQSDPGAEDAVPAPLVVQRAMELQGVSLMATCAPALPFGASIHTASTSSPGATHRRHLSSRGGVQRKRRKVSASIFIDMDAEEDKEGEEEGEEEEEEEKEEDEQEEGGSIRRPQQAEPLGKRSYLQSIDSLCKQFGSDVGDSVVVNRPPNRQIPTGIFPPPLRNIYIVDFYSASSRTFALEYIKLRGLVATTLPWLPHRVYVEASCPLEVQQNLPPSCSRSHKEITLLPPQEGTSIMAFRARQVLPTRSWVRIRKSMYTGDIGYVEESADSDAVIILIAPRRLPYDLPKESGESVRFDVELARMAGLDLVPILSPSGAEIGYSCDGQQFVHGLFRLTLPADTLEIVELPHPNDIRFHVAAGIDPYFVEETLNLFSAQFWREQDAVEIREGDLRGKKGALTNLRRVFSLGDTLEIIAGPFCGETGYVVALHERTIVLVVMWPNQTSEDIEVSRFVVRSHLQDHVLSLGPVAEPHVVLPLSEDEALPGDVVLSTSWKGKGKEDSERDPTPSQSMVAMNASDLRIERAPGTLTLSKDKGYNIAVGDTVEVARGQWRHSQGVVKAVDLIKASLDFVRLEDGIQINVPITFSRKVKERFDYGLSKFRSLKSLHNRSFITPVVPRNVTPPPSPGPSNAGPSDAWSITPDDIIRTQTPDYGEVPWLFQSEFCDFKSFHLGFNVSVGFTQVSLGKRVVRTVCPDRFVGQNGPAPSGSVCVTVTGHNAGSAIQHLTIPARYLTPANPTGKNQLCLVLKGSQAGRFSHFAGMLANPLRSDAPEGSPISGDAGVPTTQIFRTTTEVAQKRKFCEDQDSALRPSYQDLSWYFAGLSGVFHWYSGEDLDVINHLVFEAQE
ncbi:hypothetical protein EDD16DRAFT_1703204 [Pisolithus croceorrhizus]|nr:hypothetical protein EDD16DRAFT_1703204 [Pisolithus croceorrhizus]